MTTIPSAGEAEVLAAVEAPSEPSSSYLSQQQQQQQQQQPPPPPVQHAHSPVSMNRDLRGSPPVVEEQIQSTLKCPICMDWFKDPILLDCSHSLCLECARRFALHEGGTTTAMLTCPLCKEVTAVSGGDEARDLEDVLIADALKRFDIIPPRNRKGPRIEDLKACYEAFVKNGLVEIGPEDAKPTALHLWRAVVARMESQSKEALGETPAAGTTATATTNTSGGGDESAATHAASESAGSGSSTTEGGGGGGMEDPMKKLRFKKNILLNNLVTHFREQQEQRASTSPALGLPGNGSGSGGLDDDEEGYDVEMYIDRGMEEGSEDGELTEGGDERSGGNGTPKAGGTAPLNPRWGGKGKGSPQGSRHVWVGNLPIGVKEEHIRALFKPYGAIESVRMLRRTPQAMTGFVHFANSDEAIRAQKALDGKPFAGGNLPKNVMRIQYQSKGVNNPCKSIRVHNLPPRTTEKDMIELFSEFGRVSIAVINTNSNIAFLSLESTEQADRAMEKWHDQVWRGRHFFIDYALREEISKEDPYQRGDRDRQGGRERDRGGDRRPLERDRSRERLLDRERVRERMDRTRDRSRSGPRGGRGGPPPPSRYESGSDRDRGGDRGRGPPPPNRPLMLPAARGCPPFEVYAEDLEKLRELVDLMQSHLPLRQRQTLEDALQNRALYDAITVLVDRNRRDMGAVLRDLRVEMGLPVDRHHEHIHHGRYLDGPPPPGHHRGPPPAPGHHHDRDREMDRGRFDRSRDRDRMARYPSPPPADYRHGPPPPMPPHHYSRSPSRGGYRDERDYSPSRRGRDDRGRGPSLPPPPPGYYDDRRGPPPPLPGYGDRDHHERDRYGGGRPLVEGRGGGRRSPPGRSGPRRSRSRSPPLPPPGYSRGADMGGRKRSRERDGPHGGRSRSRSPSGRRRRPDDRGGPLPPPPPGPPPPPMNHHSRDREPYPPPPPGPPPPRNDFGHPHHPPPLPPGPPPSQHQQGRQPPPPPGPPPPRGPPPPAPLKAECDQFLQTLTGAVGAHAPPPAPAASAVVPSRIWLSSSMAAGYPCYDGVLNVVKEQLTPHYRAQVVDKEGFKRIAEETTLLLVQQLLEHRLEGRSDLPAHYHGVAADMVRAALPASSSS